MNGLPRQEPWESTCCLATNDLELPSLTKFGECVMGYTLHPAFLFFVKSACCSDTARLDWANWLQIVVCFVLSRGIWPVQIIDWDRLRGAVGVDPLPRPPHLHLPHSPCPVRSVPVGHHGFHFGPSHERAGFDVPLVDITSFDHRRYGWR